MTQASNTSTCFTNNITPWNRTPGKPGVGSGNISSLCSTTPMASTVSWSNKNTNTNNNNNNNSNNNRSSLIDLNPSERDKQTEDSINKTDQPNCDPINSLNSFAAPKHSENSDQMWPTSRIYESSKLLDPNSGTLTSQESSTTTNQWVNPSFPGQVVGDAGSLLGSPNNFALTNQPQNSNPWHFVGTTNFTSVPRAIIGQQLNSTISQTSSDAIPNTDQTRRYMHWTLGSEQDSLNDDRSALALSLSTMNIAGNNCATSVLNEYIDNQTNASNSQTVDNVSLDYELGQNILKSSNSDVDNLPCDSEEAIRTAVNTTEPWGLHPVDQSTPWVVSEAPDDPVMLHSCARATGSPPLADLHSTNRGSSGNPPSGISDPPPSGSQSSIHSRRLSSIGSSITRDLESNVWPSEPPNGTGVWESHYESLGERTARWQQNTSSVPATQNSFQSQFVNSPSFSPGQMPHPIVRSRTQPAPLQPNSDAHPYFRGMNRGPSSSVFPLSQPLPNSTGALNISARPPLGGTHLIGPINTNICSNTSARAFPMGNTINQTTGSSWSYTSGTNSNEPNLPGQQNIGNKTRWPNANISRSGGKQQHPNSHILPNQNPNGVRWPPPGASPQFPGIWPVSDQRRSGQITGTWSTGPSGNEPNPNNFFNQPPQVVPRGSQQLTSPDFSSPLISARGVNPTFRPPQSAFYPNINPNFSSSSLTQRMFSNLQQPTTHLQHQSMIRAHIMRQLSKLGFSDNEIQPIFTDANTNVERALIELRDRSGHPGLDELINYVKVLTSLLLATPPPATALPPSGATPAVVPSLPPPPPPPVNNLDDNINIDLCRSEHGQTSSSNCQLPLRRTNPNLNDQITKSNIPSMNNLPTENLELSLHLLHQRETQILQTIMQLHSKHQELNQKLSQLRPTNVPFVTNPVLQELQLQSVQVAQQIDAQQTQLKHVRSQAGMLKQITASSTTSTSVTTTTNNNNNNSNTSNNSNANIQSNNSVQTHNLAIPNSGLPISSPNLSTNPSNCSSLNMLVGNSSWSAQTPVANTGLNSKFNQSQTGYNSQNLDFIQDQANFNMGSLIWESTPWSGSNSQSHELYSVNKNNLSTDRRWTSSGLTNRLPLGSQIPSLGDPRWIDDANEVNENNNTNLMNTLSNDDNRQSLNDFDELHLNINQDFAVPNSIASKSWILTHNIPPHISVGMFKMIVSNALNNQLINKSIGNEQHLMNDKSNELSLFEIHPNMSARWILLGLTNSHDASIVYDCLVNPNNNNNNNNNKNSNNNNNNSHNKHNNHSDSYYGNVKMITPNEALICLQEIQSLASRLKGIRTDNSTVHSSPLSNAVADFSNVVTSDISGSSHLLNNFASQSNNPDFITS